jgi:predicted phosphoribosyltransferase
MQLVFNRQVAEDLRNKYTVLELESVTVPDGRTLEVFCVLPAESIIWEMQAMEDSVRLHEEFINSMRNNDIKSCVELSEQLKGRFSGELDSFYDTVVNRCNQTGSTKLVAV